MVHHSNKAAGSYRGSSKIGVLNNHIIELKPVPEAELCTGTAFRITFEKYRRQRDDRVGDLSVKLDPETGRWSIEADESGKLAALADLIKGGTITSQKALGEALGISQQAAAKRLKKLKAAGVMTHDEITAAMANAKARLEEAAQEFMEDDDDALADEF